MKVEDIKDLLTAISQTLTAIKDFPVFEEVIEDGSYYTMSDLTLGDAIQAVNEVSCGIEAVNSPDEFSDLYLTPNLKAAIISLSAVGTSIVRFDTTNRPSEMKAAAMEAARQDGHDISEWM